MMFKHPIKKFLRALGYQISKTDDVRSDVLVQKSLEPLGVEILFDDGEFRKSCIEAYPYTLLDTSRLANLWQLCRMSNPRGTIVEVGSYLGGGALHLANSCPQRKTFACDSFQGFEGLDEKLDTNFIDQDFRNTSRHTVQELFNSKNKDITVIAGFFPNSCRDIEIGPVSFVHLDVDVYKATIESLHYLSTKMMPLSLMILDDYNRRADGVNTAVSEFIASNKAWNIFPLFPSQCLLVHRSWFDA